MADGSDASHSSVERICQQYMKKDCRIRYQKLEENLGISSNTNACLEMATGDYIGLFDHDDLLHPAALFEIMRAIENTGADFLYTDEGTFHKTPKDSFYAHFKPAFAPDTLRSCNYICHFSVFKRTILDITGGFDPECDGSQDHDMIMRLTEKAHRVVHIPEILYYWRAHAGSVSQNIQAKPYAVTAGVLAVEKQLIRLGLKGTVYPIHPGIPRYRIHYEIAGSPRVSILILNHEHPDNLKSCIDSIIRKTSWQNYEIVIVDNNSKSSEVFAYYESIQQEHRNIRIANWRGEVNYSAMNNYGTQFCTGDYLLLLNGDCEIITSDWIQEMLMFAQRADVGAVGAKLYYANDTIQHAGVGLLAKPTCFYKHFPRETPGYYRKLWFTQNFGAVTSACMMIRRNVWEDLGGMDERWAIYLHDIDFCLRVRQAGYQIVWTPFAELYHDESQNQSAAADMLEKTACYSAALTHFQTQWAKELAAGDPYYNPNFSPDSDHFSVKRNVRPYEAR